MRKLFTLLLFLSPLFISSQNSDIKQTQSESKINEVYTIEGTDIVIHAALRNVEGTKGELFSKLKIYFEKAYSDPNSELKIDDKKNGILEVESVYFNFFEYTVDSTLPVKFHVFYTLRIEVENNDLQISCSANNWLGEWSTIGNGYKVERYSILECIPLGEKMFFEDADKTAEAFCALVTKMQQVIDDVDNALKE